MRPRMVKVLAVLCGCVVLCVANELPATDCNGDNTPDETQVPQIYVGTKGAGDGPGGGRIYKYTGGESGESWAKISPSLWEVNGDSLVSAVMDLAFYEGQLYAGVQTDHGNAGSSDGLGQVWMYDGQTWGSGPIQTLDSSVMVVKAMGPYLYVGTAYWHQSSNWGALYRYHKDGSTDVWEAFHDLGGGQSEWTIQLSLATHIGSGIRSGFVSSICGSPMLFLGDLFYDRIWRLDPNANTNQLKTVLNVNGSCIWDFAEFEYGSMTYLYAGAYGSGSFVGPVYYMSSGMCSQGFEATSLATHAHNWALETHNGRVFLGSGEPQYGAAGGKLRVFDGTAWSLVDNSAQGQVPPWRTVVSNSGVITLGTTTNAALFLGPVSLMGGRFIARLTWDTGTQLVCEG